MLGQQALDLVRPWITEVARRVPRGIQHGISFGIIGLHRKQNTATYFECQILRHGCCISCSGKLSNFGSHVNRAEGSGD